MPKPPTTAPAFHAKLKVFGDAWMLIIVNELMQGTCRFNALQRRTCGISPVTLTDRLKKLERLGIIERSTHVQDRLSVSYCLTEKGEAMRPVMQKIRDFSDRHLDGFPDCPK